MFEVFDKLMGAGDKECKKMLDSEYERDPAIAKFLKSYVIDQDNIITPVKILKMMIYFGVEKATHLDKIGEIGEFAAQRTKVLKMKEFQYYKGGNRATVDMNNIQFAIDVIKKLKREVKSNNQYNILKNAFVLMNYNDVKWFTRFLCKRVKVIQPMYDIIKKYNLEEMGNEQV